MPEATHCPDCGAVIPDGQPTGLCPRCALKGALELSGTTSAPHPASGYPLPSDGRGAGGEGRSFGDYELLEEIARGGMGIVFKARQRKLDRIVAVKMILAGEFASKEQALRFRVEAEAAARLQHPNIVRIHETGEQDGQPYFSMDYVEGGNLASLVREKPLPAKRAAGYVKTIAEAIHHAHEQGILHRDLKPSNVLIDHADQPHITDFGLAKRMTKESFLTATGDVMGSPSFMPPEQAGFRSSRREEAPVKSEVRVQRSEADQSLVTSAATKVKAGRYSDVYGLGAILFYLVTGRPPFVAENVAETLHHVLNTEPVSPRLLNPSVPQDIATICLKCLEKEPPKRYQTAQEMGEDLGRFLKGEPLRARPVGRPEKVWRWCVRNPNLSSALGALALAIVAGLVVSLWQARRAGKNARLAEQASVRAFLGQARGQRLSGLAGRRFDSLAVLAQAAKIAPSRALRDEAIACLALMDARVGKTWPGFPRGSTALAFSRDLDRYARSDEAGNISVHQTSDGRELMRLRTFEPTGQPMNQPAKRLVFSPDGQHLAALHGSPTEVGLWHLATRQAVPLPMTRASEEAVDFSPDGKQIALADTNGTVAIIDLAARRIVASFPSERPLFRLRFDPAGSLLAASSLENLNVLVFDLTTNAPPRALFHPHVVRDLAWHPKGGVLATACGNHQIYLWNVEPGESFNEPTVFAAPDAPHTLAFNHRGDVLASSGADRTLRFWNHPTGRPLFQLEGVDLSELSFSRDDLQLGGIVAGANLQLLELAPERGWQRLSSPRIYPQHVRDMDVSPDERFLGLAAGDGVHLYDLAAGGELDLLQIESVDALRFQPTSGELITRGFFGLHRWPCELDRRLGPEFLLVGPPVLYDFPPGAGLISLSADGDTWAAAAEDRVMVFRSDRFAPVRELPAGPGVKAVAISGDARWLACDSGRMDAVQIWDAAQGALLTNLAVNGRPQLAFSPNHRWLATATERECVLWQTGVWTNRATLPRRSSSPRRCPLAFTPDSRLLAFAESETLVALFDCTTDRTVATLEAPERALLAALRFSGDGARLFCAGEAGSLSAWDLPALRSELAPLRLDWTGPGALAKPPTQVPTPARLLSNRRFFEQAQKNLEALQKFSETLQESNTPTHWAARGRQNQTWGRHERAVKDYTQALQGEIRTNWLTQRAYSRTWLHQYPEAIADFEQCLQLEPGMLKAHFELAYIRFQGRTAFRDHADGVRHATEALRLAPTNRTCLLWMALAEYRSGRWAESQQHLARTVADGKTALTPNALFVQAMNRARLGELAAARKSFEQGRRLVIDRYLDNYFGDRLYTRVFLEEAAQVLAEEESRPRSGAAQFIR